MYICGCSGCSQKMEEVVVSKAEVLTLWPREELQIRENGIPNPVTGPGQSASAWVAGDPQCPSKEIWRTREELMNTCKQGKNNSLNFSFWLLIAHNATWRCCGVCAPNCLNIQQLASVKQSSPQVWSPRGLQTAEMGAHWREVGFPPH